MVIAGMSTRGSPLGEVMKLPQTGGCQCGKIRYEISEEPRSIYTCHCLDCQRLTGTAFSLGIVVPETGFRLTGIEPRRLQRTADSGRVNTRLVCPDCGSSICGMPRNGVIGFIFGTIWVLLLVPRLGETTAVIIEAPIILAASWFVCRWCVDRLDVEPTVPARSLMGLVAFLVLMS